MARSGAHFREPVAGSTARCLAPPRCLAPLGIPDGVAGDGAEPQERRGEELNAATAPRASQQCLDLAAQVVDRGFDLGRRDIGRHQKVPRLVEVGPIGDGVAVVQRLGHPTAQVHRRETFKPAVVRRLRSQFLHGVDRNGQVVIRRHLKRFGAMLASRPVRHPIIGHANLWRWDMMCG